ncbi:MAG: hypothetical protein DHS20C06_16650 [Hyphobacterium sp.]|nr:MAG: hypothetical protein DHS20C06_16650 [Hyphobacterium sp.]
MIAKLTSLLIKLFVVTQIGAAALLPVVSRFDYGQHNLLENIKIVAGGGAILFIVSFILRVLPSLKNIKNSDQANIGVLDVITGKYL